MKTNPTKTKSNQHLIVPILATIFTFTSIFSFTKNESSKIGISISDSAITKKSMKGKTALFIGDSHTANHQFGWQKLLCDRTGMVIKNVSSVGKTTYWMLDQSVYAMNKNIDILFIYGGANDMSSFEIAPDECIENIQRMVNIGAGYGIPVVVITGFNPNITTIKNRDYKIKYGMLQKLMLTHLRGCRVIDIRSTIIKSDCGDELCHMNKSGHEKIASKIIWDMNFESLEQQ